MLKHRRLLSAGTALFAGAVAASAPARAQSWNLYGNYTSLPTIPFTGGPMSATNGASVYLKMTGANPTPFVMDTGSTGIIVTGDHFKPGPNDLAVGTGSQYYSSSGLLSTGTFYRTNVVINNGPNTPLATSTVTVLLVTNQTCLIPGRNCTPSSNPTGVAYMGVGFDRGASSINAPAAYGNTNPFINIVSLANNNPISTLRQGYLITNSGVTLGLSNTPTVNNNNPASNFAFVKLTPNTPNSGQPAPAWQQAPMTISVGGRHRQRPDPAGCRDRLFVPHATTERRAPDDELPQSSWGHQLHRAVQRRADSGLPAGTKDAAAGRV